MRRPLLALLLAGTMLAGVAQPARAEPITASIMAFAATQLGGIVVSTVVSVAFSFGASLLRNMFAPTPSKPKPNLALRLSVATGGIVPQSFIVGDWATAGSMNYRGSFGTDNGTPNAYYVEERVLSDVPVPALTGFWYGPQKATLLTAEPHAEFGWPVAQARRNGVDHMWVKYRDGSQTTADPYLLARFGSHPQFPYTAEMTGRGRAVAIVTRKVPNEDNRDLFPANLEYKFETSGIALYDLSKDSTAGGFGSHRWDDPTTWEPSGNTAVQIYNILRGIRWGEEWLFGLQTLSPTRLPASAWIAAINECNVAMGLAAGGTEPQFRTGAEITVDMDAAGVIEELLAGASGRIAEVGGIYKPLFGAPGAAVMSFTDRDIVVTRDQGFSPDPRLEETYNGVRPKYVNPENGWDLSDAPARYDPIQEAEDGGRQLMADITLKTVSSVTRTQRLTKTAHEEQRRWRKHRLGFAPLFSELEPLDVVSWTSSENGYANKKFLVTELEDEPTYLQAASLQELDPADYDYDAGTEEQPGWSAPIGIVRPPPQVAVGWNVEGQAWNGNDGRGRRPSVVWTWDGDIEDVVAVAFEARIRTGPDAGVIILTESTDRVSDGAIRHVGGRLLPGLPCEGRIRYRPRGARQTDWTDWLPFDLPDIRMSVHDIDDAMRRQTGILDGDGSLLEKIEQLWAALERSAAAAADTAIESHMQREELKAESGNIRAYFLNEVSVLVSADEALASSITALTAEFEDNAAFVATQLTALATADTALASAITQVEAEVGDVSAGGFFAMKVDIAPAGWDVSLAMIARASVGGVDYEAGIYLWLKSGGQTGVAIKANDFYLLNDSGGYLTTPFSVVGGIVEMTNVRIDGAYIKDLTVDTLKVTGGAITSSAAFYQTVEVGPNVALVSGAFNVLYGSVKVLFTGYQWRPDEDASNFGGYQLRVLRNGTVINTLSLYYDDNFAGVVSIAAIDTPGPGVHTYTIDSVVGWGPGNINFIVGGALFLDNFKR